MFEQVVIPIIVMMLLFAMMAVGLIFKGRPLAKSCGGVSAEEIHECLICDGGKKPEQCPD